MTPPPKHKPGRRTASPPEDDWSALKPIAAPTVAIPRAPPPSATPAANPAAAGDPANAGIRREPELPEHEAIAPETPPVRPSREFDDDDDEQDGDLDAVKARVLQARAVAGLARQVTMNPAC